MKLYFRRATKILLQTLPFVLLRIGVGIGFGILTAIYFGVVVGALWYLSGSLSMYILAGIFVVSLGGFLLLSRILKKYILYLVTAGHIATIAYIIDRGKVPENQLSFGKSQVKDRFVEASVLFAIDKVIKSVLRQFNSAVLSLSALAGFVPALKSIVGIFRRAITMAAKNLDEAILAHIFMNPNKGNWTAARDGLVLYAKTWKPVLATTVLLVLASYVVLGLIALAASPLAIWFEGLTPMGEAIGWIGVIGVAAIIYFGFINPWIKTVVITTFLIEAQNETPDSETMDLLESKASNFTEVIEKAGRDKTQQINSEDFGN